MKMSLHQGRRSLTLFDFVQSLPHQEDVARLVLRSASIFPLPLQKAVELCCPGGKKMWRSYDPD